jgi:cytochrome c-type biogenesis protein CcmH/NrfG
MKTYTVTFERIQTKDIDIKANSLQEAIEQALSINLDDNPSGSEDWQLSASTQTNNGNYSEAQALPPELKGI